VSITLDEITLPPDLHWANEFNWSRVARAEDYLLSGALIVEETLKQAGRPIRLYGAVATRNTIESLQAKENPAEDMVLTIYGNQFTVRFAGDSPIQATLFVPEQADGQSGDTLFWLTLNFIEV